MKKRFLLLVMIICSINAYSQNDHSELLFQYFGANENQNEINYIRSILANNNLTIPGPEQEKAILEAHEFFLAHKDEIEMNMKVNELIQFRDAVKGAKAAALTIALNSIIAGLPAAFEAGKKQQEENFKRMQRDKEILSYISNHSSSSDTYKHYSQPFADNNTTVSQPHQRRVTTSNGFESPLPSASNSSGYTNTIGGTSNASNERIIQAVYVSGNQLVTCRLRYNSGRIWAYSSSKNSLSEENWIPFQTPESPTSTLSIRDGDYAKDYKNTVSGGGMTFYFNY